MRKRYPTILVLGAILGFLISEFRPKEEIPIPYLSKYERKYDSLEAQISLIGDSLQAARFVLANRENELQTAHKRTAQALKQRNEIRFVKHENDSIRLANLAELYPSMKKGPQ